MNNPGDQDRRWLDSAVRLARPHLGTTKGGPLAAALLVDAPEGRVFARAVTTADCISAATAAVAQARGVAAGRTLVTTLEPDPEPVLEAGIARVVVGALHPDPSRRGQGAVALERAGVEVIRAEHEPSRELLAPFASRILRGRPFVTLRLAMSRDGMIARSDGSPVTIMGKRALRWAHLQRALSDAVMIGARTAELDDPRLEMELKGFGDRTYARVIALGKNPLPPRLKLTGWPSGYPVYVLTEEGRDVESAPPVEVLGIPGRNGRPDLRKALTELASRGIAALLVEGGARFTEAMIAAEVVDRLHLIQSTNEIGRGGLPATPLGRIEGRLHAAGLTEVGSVLLGEDLLRTFEPRL